MSEARLGPVCRVDDRLLHSEVIYGVVEACDIDQLIVASRLEWASTTGRSIVPANVDVAVVTPVEAASTPVVGLHPLVVLGTPLDLAESVEAGLSPSGVALANRASRPNTRQLSPTFWVDDAERTALAGLLERGLAITLQRMPFEPPVALEEAMLNDANESDDGTT